MTEDYARGYLEATDDLIGVMRDVEEAVVHELPHKEISQIMAKSLTTIAVKRKITKNQMKEGK